MHISKAELSFVFWYFACFSCPDNSLKVCSFSANSPEVSAGGQILGLILVKWKFTVDYVKIDQNYDQDLQ